LWTKRRAGRGAPPRNTLSRNPHRALVRSHESEAFASGNAQKPRFRGGPPRPPGAASQARRRLALQLEGEAARTQDPPPHA